MSNSIDNNYMWFEVLPLTMAMTSIFIEWTGHNYEFVSSAKPVPAKRKIGIIPVVGLSVIIIIGVMSLVGAMFDQTGWVPFLVGTSMMFAFSFTMFVWLFNERKFSLKTSNI
jgi:hypothetical protein